MNKVGHRKSTSTKEKKPDMYSMWAYVHPVEYAYKKTGGRVKFLLLLLLVIWLAQELWFRSIVPQPRYPGLNRFLDIVSVLWGSLFTGYIFHWIVDRYPRFRKQFLRDLSVERRFAHMLQQYMMLHVELMKHVPIEKVTDHRIWDMHSAYDITTIPVTARLDKRLRWILDAPNFDEAISHHGGRIKQEISLLLEKKKLSYPVRYCAKQANGSAQAKTGVGLPEDAREKDYITLNRAIHPLMQCRAVLMQEGILGPYLRDVPEISSLEQAWDLAQIVKRDRTIIADGLLLKIDLSHRVVKDRYR